MTMNEKIRTIVKECLDKKEVPTSSKGRNQFFEKIAEQHSKDESDPIVWKSHRTIFSNELKKELVKRNIDPVTYGLSRPSSHMKQFEDSQLKANIQPMPKGRQLQQTQTMQQQQTNVLQTKNQAMQGIDPTQQQPMMQQESLITEEMVRATWETIDSLITVKFPSWQTLKEEQLKTLGKVWLPIFQEYLNTATGGKWAIPLWVTGGMFLPRILTAKLETDNEKKQDKREPAKERKADQQKPNSDSMSWEEYEKKLKSRNR